LVLFNLSPTDRGLEARSGSDPHDANEYQTDGLAALNESGKTIMYITRSASRLRLADLG
jgi:hypothetical protein